MASIYARGRDNARTPMQWTDSENAGFTTGTPWMPLNPNYHEINAAQALADPDSVFHYYRRLIHLRKTIPVIRHGDFTLLDADNEKVFSYVRRDDEHELLVVCNFTPVVRHHYRIGAPRPGVYQEVLNSDATEFGGSGILNAGDLTTEAIPMHGRPQSLELTLPPLGTIYLQLVKEGDSHENPENKKDPRPAEAGEAGSGH